MLTCKNVIDYNEGEVKLVNASLIAHHPPEFHLKAMNMDGCFVLCGLASFTTFIYCERNGGK